MQQTIINFIMIASMVAAAGFFAWFLFETFRNLRVPKPWEWRRSDRLWPVTLIDGRRSWGDLMRRRRPDGAWEYREESKAEADQHLDDRVW